MNRNNKILVISDDLTGCGDSAYWAIKKGISCNIYENINSLYKSKSLKDITIVNTATRHSSITKAYRAVEKICIWAKKKNFVKIFKKIDSTLRGNFVYEIDALCKTFGNKYVPLVAAYPEYARTTKNGYHYVNGIRIDKTEFAKDPKSPVTCAHIPTILKQGCYTKNVVVRNVTTINNMNRVAQNSIKKWEQMKTKHQIAIGTSRFFGSLLDIWHKNISIPEKNLKVFKNIIIAAASVNSVTKKQIKHLTVSKNFKVTFKSKYLIVYKYKDIYIITPINKMIKKYPLQLFVEKVKQISHYMQKVLFILCGGDTAETICKSLKIDIIEVIKPLDIGIIIGKDAKTSRFIILKSGGFGAQDLLSYFLERFYTNCVRATLG